MKKAVKKSSGSSVRSKSSNVKHVGDGTAIITHSQSVKQSQNYNSAECVYGVQMTVTDDDASIKAGFMRAEELVEAPLVDKFALQQEMLSRL